MKLRDFWYWVSISGSLILVITGIIFSGLLAFVLSNVVVFLGGAKFGTGAGAVSGTIGGLTITVLVSIAGVCVAAIGIFAGIVFGWRSDRRQAREAVLRVKELELKITELQRGADEQAG